MKSPQEDERRMPELQEWRVTPPRNPRFRTEVWARIGAWRREASWSGYVRRHAAGLAGALTVALLLGGWIGRTEARARVEAERTAIATQYVRALDARAMTAPTP